MGKGHPIDRDKMHQFFWEKSDRWGVYILNQKKLAELMNIAPETMSRVVKKMIEEKRMSKMGAKRHNISSYLVKNPTDWKVRRDAIQED